MKDNHTLEFMKDASPLRKVMKQILNASYQGHKEGCLYCAEVNELADHARPDECAEGDLLGEALDALKAHSLIMADIHFAMGNAIINNTDLDADLRTLFHGEKTRDREVAISAILAKRKGDTA